MNAHSAWSKLFCCFFVAAMLSMGSAEAMAESQYLIVESKPPTETLEVGKLLAVGDTLDIPSGTVVTLLGENGSINKLVGPVVIAVTEDTGEAVSSDEKARKRSTLSKIGELLVGEQKSADTLGVSRSTNARFDKASIDPWAIPLSAPVGCVLDRKIRLMRNNSDRDIIVSMGFNQGAHGPGQLWDADDKYLDYGGEVPEHATMLTVTADNATRDIKLVLAPANLDRTDNIKLLKFMAESNCASQLASLLQKLGTK